MGGACGGPGRSRSESMIRIHVRKINNFNENTSKVRRINIISLSSDGWKQVLRYIFMISENICIYIVEDRSEFKRKRRSKNSVSSLSHLFLI